MQVLKDPIHLPRQNHYSLIFTFHLFQVESTKYLGQVHKMHENSASDEGKNYKKAD